MSRDLSDLEPGFRVPCEQLIDVCARDGVVMVPFFTLRDPYTQAKLWRQSRSRAEVEAALAKFKKAGADFLAYCLESVGPQHGRWLTNSLPGYSWHQWALATDFYWLVDGKAEWSALRYGERNGYRILARVAKTLGLTPGGHWKTAKDWPHVQKYSYEVGEMIGVRQVDEEMRERFDGG